MRIGLVTADGAEDGEEVMVTYGKRRSATDLAFLIIFGLTSVLWLGIGIYAFKDGYGIPDQIIDQDAMDKFMQALCGNKGAYFGFVWFTALLIALFFIMVRWVTKLTVYLTLFIVCCYQMLSSYFFLKSATTIGVIAMILLWAIYGGMIYALRKFGSQAVCKILQDSCKSIGCFPSSFVIVLLEIVVQLGIIVFTTAATLYFLHLKEVNISLSRRRIEVDPPKYAMVLLPIFIVSACWILVFVAEFRRMILHGIYSHWYRASDKKNIPITAGIRCCLTTSRYHLGTVAFSSTIFALFPVIAAVVNSGRALGRLIKKRPSTLIVLLVAISESLVNASIMCISFGTSLSRSTIDGLQFVMRNPLKYLLSTMMSYWISLFGLLFIPLITAGISYSYFITQINTTDADQYWIHLIIPVVITSLLSATLTAILIVIFKSATEAVTVCHLEELNSSKPSLVDEDCEE